MNLSNWKTMLFSAQGRIRRSEYWLWSVISVIGLMIIQYILGMIFVDYKSVTITGALPTSFWLVYLVTIIPSLWISICLASKRWHDRDKSAWMILIILIPIIGAIWYFVEVGCLDGTQGPNKYGPSPKGIGAATDVF